MLYVALQRMHERLPAFFKFKNVDSPHCACGEVETTKTLHYITFFECQRYTEIMTIMLNE